MGAIVSHLEHCPMPTTGGGDCWAEPHPASRFGLCVAHWKDVVQDWVSDTPETIRRCPRCDWSNRYDTADWASAECQKCAAKMDAPWLVSEHHERTELIAEAEAGPRGVVYFLRFGDLVKIGFTESFAKRMSSIPHDEILAVEPGDYRSEKRRHQQFAHRRREGQREWFHAEADVLTFAAGVRAEHGDPWVTAAEIEKQNVDAATLRQGGMSILG